VRCTWGSARVFLKAVWKTPDGMAKRPSTPGDLRDAVERTVQATLGSAERQRERTQGALDDLAGTVDQLRRGAEAGIARGRRVIEERRPATSEDIRELKAELRRIGRRLDQIEERLPAKRSGGAKRSASSGAAKRSASGGAKRPGSGGRRSS
jgi:chromosome segregation ATPase